MSRLSRHSRGRPLIAVSGAGCDKPAVLWQEMKAMRNSRLGDFPLVLAMLGMTLAGCAGVETGRDVAMAPAAMGLAPTASGDIGFPETGTLDALDFGTTETPGLAPAGHLAAEAVRRMAREAMAVLSDSSLSAEQRAQGLRRLVARAIDIPPIARFVLGRYWRATSERQRQAYVAAYSDYILAAYTAKIGGGGRRSSASMWSRPRPTGPRISRSIASSPGPAASRPAPSGGCASGTAATASST